MMYARMPRLTPEDRLMRLEPLDLSGARIEPADALQGLEQPAQRLRVAMLGVRAVYRIHDGVRWTTVYADSGERLAAMDRAAAVAQAATFAPDRAATIRYDARIEDPDQWTLQVRPLLPAHRIALGDRDRTEVYVSERTGEPVLATTRSSRFWGYAGAVFHWIYFTPIRRNGPAWTQLIIWTSIAGSLLCLSGIVWGVWRYSTESRYRLRGVPHSHTPYAGLMRWHHYTGLVFGLITFTWVFSGLLSMNPWNWSPETAPTRQQREAVSGGPPAFDRVALAALRSAAETLGRSLAVKEIELLQFRGEMVAEAYRAPDPARPSHPASMIPAPCTHRASRSITCSCRSHTRRATHLCNSTNATWKTRPAPPCLASLSRNRPGSPSTTRITTIARQRCRCRCCACASPTRRTRGSIWIRHAVRFCRKRSG